MGHKSANIKNYWPHVDRSCTMWCVTLEGDGTVCVLHMGLTLNIHGCKNGLISLFLRHFHYNTKFFYVYDRVETFRNAAAVPLCRQIM